MRADHVQNEKERDANVSGVGELQTPIREQKNKREKNNEDVLQNPRVLIERVDRRDKPGHNAEGRQTGEDFFLFVHENGWPRNERAVSK